VKALIALALLVAAGCASIQPTIAAVPRTANADTAPIPADKKLHWGWTVAVIVVVVLVVAYKQATDFDWKTDDDGGFFGRRPHGR
jgi:uncharacterized protein YceK